LENRLFKGEKSKSSKWDETVVTDIEEEVMKNT